MNSHLLSKKKISKSSFSNLFIRSHFDDNISKRVRVCNVDTGQNNQTINQHLIFN